MRRIPSAICRSAAVVLTAFLTVYSPPVAADPIVSYTATLQGGLYQYDLTINNAAGTEAVDGLIVVNGYSVFGISTSSTVTSPAGWMGMATGTGMGMGSGPLAYFALSSAADVQMGQSLGGFIFDSTVSPDTLMSGDFEVRTINDGCTDPDACGEESDAIDPRPAPEPTMLWTLAAAGVVVATLRRRRCKSDLDPRITA